MYDQDICKFVKHYPDQNIKHSILPPFNHHEANFDISNRGTIHTLKSLFLIITLKLTIVCHMYLIFQTVPMVCGVSYIQG